MKKIVFDDQEFLSCSWEEMSDFCFKLAQEIQKSNGFDQIVAISRGGLIVGRILADFLDLPISLFTIKAYKEIGKIKKPEITEELNAKIQGKKILLVDEIIDTGKTLALALSYLRRLKPQKIQTAVLFYKQKAKTAPDYFLFKTTAWVVFPYEVRETINDLSQIWQKKGISKTEIKSHLSKLGLPKKEVEHFLK
ncbi:phosphoribosyltransferase [Candidatus Microgenomates bacterium]|nr:phosphoribosyltransferase [Candidatus Microgenomates bacterium]